MEVIVNVTYSTHRPPFNWVHVSRKSSSDLSTDIKNVIAESTFSTSAIVSRNPYNFYSLALLCQLDI